MYGWAGTILRVDLSSGQIEKEPLDENLGRDYIGGRGINSKILYDEVKPGIDPLGPENRLIFGSGPLSGTIAPAAGRMTISAKSPLTGILGDANGGGYFAPELKFAGYDHIVFKGKSDGPVYLWIENDKVELRSAEHLWGKTTWETEKIIKEELRDPEIKIASIGLGGENLVKFACVITNLYNAAGRTGMGAVMGSKNLKAIAVRGTRGFKIAEPEIFTRLAQALHQRIVKNPGYEAFSTYGTTTIASLTNELGVLAVRNYQQMGGFKGINSIDEKACERYFTKSIDCFSCPIHCGHLYEVKEGPYAGERGGRVEYLNQAVAAASDISYLPAILKLKNLCDQYGIDSFSGGCMIPIVMEWYEKGIITKEDTEGIALEWGNYEAVIELTHKIVKREGFGDILAEGAVKAAEKIGKGAEKYVSHSKGLTFVGDDVRGVKGYALNNATSTRGADHLRGTPIPAEWLQMSPEVGKERFGSEEAVIPTSYNKARVTFYYQNLCTIADALEICKFVTEWMGQEIGLKDMAGLFSAATGVEMDEKGITEVAERVYTIERAFIVREGITRKDDALVGKWGREPVPNGPFKGESIDPEKFNKLLDEYYTLRGWNKKTGVPTRAKLERLGLKGVADELESLGKL